MVAATTLIVALLAATSQAIASSHNVLGRSLHDGSHHHKVAVARDYISPNLSSPLAKRHEANKKRTNVKRARRCKPKPKPTGPKTNTTPSKNTPVKDKDDDDSPPPKADPPKPTPPKADPPKADPPKHNSSDDDPPPTHSGTGVFGVHDGGDATFYATGLNACGTVDKDSDFIAAAAFEMFDNFPGHTANPNKNPICHRRVRATLGGKSITVKITDRCAGCMIANSLDFSPDAFKALADPDLGRVHGLSWYFIDNEL